jgi:hypothetical protein
VEKLWNDMGNINFVKSKAQKMADWKGDGSRNPVVAVSHGE